MLGVAQLINEGSSYEASNNPELALRLFKTAFNNLLDINVQISSVTASHMPGVSPFEIRSVADYINYRICHIQFALNHPRDAITQFKKYVDVFKQHTKSPEYAFEHAAWLSQQYLMFADLFHTAVTNGVKASKAQHPGYYYHEAALQMINRRRNITEYTNDTIRSNQMPVTEELLAMITAPNFPSFLRQCGWTCVDPNTGPPIEPTNQANLQPGTSTSDPEPINYSATIVKELYKAKEYFEEWSRPRMISYICVMIADEYLLNKDLQNALTLYGRALSMYEKEGWTMLVDDVKAKMLLCEEGGKADQTESQNL